MNDLAKNVVLWVVIAVVLATVVSNFSSRGQTVQEMPYSAFLTHVKDGTVSQVTFSGDKISGLRSSGEQFVVYNPETDNSALIGTLQQSGVKARHHVGAALRGQLGGVFACFLKVRAVLD